jgi:DNA-binding IclR family transcriptional regulator
MPNRRPWPTIQSIDRTATILKTLASGPRHLGVSELAERLGLARPTVHGLLQTLQAHGFVEQDPASDKYQLGPGLLQLGYSHLDLNELRARSVTYADRLAVRTRAAVRVRVGHGASVVVIHHVFSPETAFGVLEVGAQLPLHASALGKAILTLSSPELVEDPLAEPLARLTKHTLGSEELRHELQVIREHGLATERDEAVLGESSVGAAMFGHIRTGGGSHRGGRCQRETLSTRTGSRRWGGGQRGCSWNLPGAGCSPLALCRRGSVTVESTFGPTSEPSWIAGSVAIDPGMGRRSIPVGGPGLWATLSQPLGLVQAVDGR